jgi:hypothetical protein
LFFHYYSLKIIIAQAAIIAAIFHAAPLESGVPSRMGKGHCGPISLLTLYRREQSDNPV